MNLILYKLVCHGNENLYWALMSSASLVWVHPLVFSGDAGWWMDSLSSSCVVWMPKVPWSAVCWAVMRVRLQWWCNVRENVRIKLWVQIFFFPPMHSPGHTAWLNHRAFELMKVHKVWRKKIGRDKACFISVFSERATMCIKSINKSNEQMYFCK